ncbi:hypothetical protein GJ496_010140 [Pomphorhynchus laevis]|nr:hypothetical protein GJ496_010140 [Pomphorhynchus laevis]
MLGNGVNAVKQLMLSTDSEIKTICTLLELVMESNTFTFNDNIFRQNEERRWVALYNTHMQGCMWHTTVAYNIFLIRREILHSIAEVNAHMLDTICR